MTTVHIRLCKTCNTYKTAEEFHKEAKKPDGLKTQCKECANKRGRLHYATSPERSRKQKEHARRKNLQQYGLTVEAYEQLLKDQNYCCAICKSVNSNGSRLSVDHCHKSGELRALTCNKCNVMLGMAQDNPAILRAGADYLERMNDPDLERQVVPQTLMEFQFV